MEPTGSRGQEVIHRRRRRHHHHHPVLSSTRAFPQARATMSGSGQASEQISD